MNEPQVTTQLPPSFPAFDKNRVQDEYGTPPLENGDRLTSDEFRRRYEAMPDVEKAELLKGVVYLSTPNLPEHHCPPGCAAHADDVSPLENGDRLDSDEFMRRYDAMPELKKAELIHGKVYMGSPVKTRHSEPHGSAMGWLVVYSAATPGTAHADNSTLRFDKQHTPQPDALLRVRNEYGGNAFVDEEDYLCGAPELVVEISASSVSYDLHDKKETYIRFGIQEYVVWRTLDHALDWFRLEGNAYVKVEPDANGIIESSVFPGLRLNVAALLAGDMATVLAELQRGIASPAHAAFVGQLAQRKQQLTTN